MFTIALTGGIASGKSTVARYFAELGVSIIDADQIGRELIDSSSEIRNQLIARFGASLLKKIRLSIGINYEQLFLLNPANVNGSNYYCIRQFTKK